VREEDFRIVMVEELLEEQPQLSGPIIVCSPVPLPHLRLAEKEPSWTWGSQHPSKAIRVYCPLPVSSAEITAMNPSRLKALAKALVSAWDCHSWWEAVAQALYAPQRPPKVVPAKLRSYLGSLLDKAASHLSSEAPEEIAEAIRRLQRWLEAKDPEEALRLSGQLYPSATSLAADVYIVRALAQAPQEAMLVAAARRFLMEAATSDRELELSRALASEQLSYVVVAVEPHRLPVAKLALEAFRQRYRAAYEAYHHSYWEAVRQLRKRLSKASTLVQALERLNRLPELGPPGGLTVLARYHTLMRILEPCQAEGPIFSEPLSSRCHQCQLEMGSPPPQAEVDEVLSGLNEALGEQMSRLAKALAAMVITAQDPIIEKALKVVQASQVAPLAQMLDDQVTAFLRRCLVETKVREAISPVLDRIQAGQTPTPEETERAGRQVRQLLSALLAPPKNST